MISDFPSVLSFSRDDSTYMRFAEDGVIHHFLIQAIGEDGKIIDEVSFKPDAHAVPDISIGLDD